jgi:hypothetical protein
VASQPIYIYNKTLLIWFGLLPYPPALVFIARFFARIKLKLPPLMHLCLAFACSPIWF